jgi:hypothetical protein
LALKSCVHELGACAEPCFTSVIESRGIGGEIRDVGLGDHPTLVALRGGRPIALAKFERAACVAPPDDDQLFAGTLEASSDSADVPVAVPVMNDNLFT